MDILSMKRKRAAKAGIEAFAAASILAGCTSTGEVNDPSSTPVQRPDTSYCSYEAPSSAQLRQQRVLTIDNLKIQGHTSSHRFTLLLDSEGYKPTSTSEKLLSGNGAVGYQYPAHDGDRISDHHFLVEVGGHICGPLLELVVESNDTAHLAKV